MVWTRDTIKQCDFGVKQISITRKKQKINSKDIFWGNPNPIWTVAQLDIRGCTTHPAQPGAIFRRVDIIHHRGDKIQTTTRGDRGNNSCARQRMQRRTPAVPLEENIMARRSQFCNQPTRPSRTKRDPTSRKQEESYYSLNKSSIALLPSLLRWRRFWTLPKATIENPGVMAT